MNRHLAHWPDVLDTELVVRGRRVRILRSAFEGPGVGEPQLLVHGLGGSAGTWIDVMAGLAHHGPVVAVDLPGFGRTAPTVDDDLTVIGYVSFVLDVAEALSWDRFTLHGNSMGGLVALHLTASRPDRVERLVLVSPALPGRRPARMLVPARAQVAGLLPFIVSSTGAATLGAIGISRASLRARARRDFLNLIYADAAAANHRVLRMLAADHTHPSITPRQRRRAFVIALGSISRAWAAPRRTWRAIAQVEPPTLVLGGTRDALVRSRTLRSVLAARSDWAGAVLDDRRHALMMEDPSGYLDLFDAWRRGTAASEVPLTHARSTPHPTEAP